MPARTDPLTPIHKALRAMIYSLGGRLQTLDFADREAAKSLLTELRMDFGAALGTKCTMCLLHSHAEHEEDNMFPATLHFEPELTRTLLADHLIFTDRLKTLQALSEKIVAADDAQVRVQLGTQLNHEANEFFALYLTHMNKEEERLVPAMQKHMTDEQMGAISEKIIRDTPPERLMPFMEWLFPALNVDELTGMLGGVQRSAPPPVFARMTGLAASKVDPARWRVVSTRLGLHPSGRGPS